MSGANKIERAARAMSLSGGGAVLRRLPAWSGVLTFCFHRIGSPGDPGWDSSLWDVRIDQLDCRLALLRRHADVIAPSDLLGIEAAPRGRHVLLTFDDGYREWATDVLPLLQSHGVSAAFFLATGFIDRPRPPWWYEVPWMVRHASATHLPGEGWLREPLRIDGARCDHAIEALLDIYKTLPGDQTEFFLAWIGEATRSGSCDPTATENDWLTWDMVRELRDAGMEIGGHTVDHPILANLPPQEQHDQITGCARRIEAELGQPMRMFSYPVGLPGSFGAHAREALEAEGVRLAFGYHGGFA